MKTTKRHLSIDIETYSSTDIKLGVYKYADSPDFDILIFGYAWDDDPVQVLSLIEGDELPQEVFYALTDHHVTKHAYNAQFERVCLSRYTGLYLDPHQWCCTQAQACISGLPLGLARVGEALSLNKDKQKDSAGKALIRYFSVPSKTKGRIRNMPYHDWGRWDKYLSYNGQDVVSEHAIASRADVYDIDERERTIYAVDQIINDRGVLIDMQLVDNVRKYMDDYKTQLLNEARSISGLDNPNANGQLLEWLRRYHPNLESADKEHVKELLALEDLLPEVRRMLEIRQELSKTSLSKYDMMRNAACSDDRIRGVLQYYGANRTGRWAGRLVQVKNLPRNNIDKEMLDAVRTWVKQGDFETLEMLYDNVPDILSQLIRTAFIPSDGKKYIVCDYSAIEARVIAWLAQEEWRQEVFRTTGKIYEASAAQMFHVPIEEVTKGSDYRKKGKVAELALGYQGAVGALKIMGGEKMGLTEQEMLDIVKRWRKASPHIVQLWSDLENCAKAAIREKVPQQLGRYGIEFTYTDGNLCIKLPVGRSLHYRDVTVNKKTGRIKYMGTSQTSGRWCQQETYGGKLTENIVQAIARDVLADAIVRLHNANYDIVFHVHDEVVIEVDAATADSDYKLVKEIMCMPVSWAPGLILNADGFTADYYQKD